jgi:DNA-directed RNA polymerase subunit RPC12/RpoP
LSEEYDEEIIEWLKRSRELVGELEPVYITPEGEVIDGRHRLKAYPGWKTQLIQAADIDKIIQRLHRNIHRKPTKQELKQIVIQLALTFEKTGVPKTELIDKIKQHLPFSEDYIRSLLPAKFKREYKKKEKPAVKMLTEKPTPKPQPEQRETKRYLTCPVCASKLLLKGEVLLPA